MRRDSLLVARDSHAMFKIEGKEHYLTRGEVAILVKRDRHRIRQLEREGRIPAPVRVKRGEITVRMYSPEQVAVIIEHFQKYGSPRRRQHWRAPNEHKGMSKRLKG